MTNKLYLIQNPVFLTCHWAPTGDPKIPLACVWTGSKHFQSASTACSADEQAAEKLLNSKITAPSGY